MTDARGLDELRVVVADDDADQRMLVVGLLRAAGITDVREAADGADALKVVSADPPDLVVLDLAMPARSGLDVLPDLRAAGPGIQVVVLSNLPRWKMAELAFERGAVGYVEKRVPPSRLVSSILLAAALVERAAATASVSLEARTSASREARRFLAELLGDSDLGLLQSAQLLISELVTNAIIHASSAPVVEVHLDPTSLRVSVYDEDPRLPRPGDPDPDQPGGRGLLLLDRLASAWAAEPSGTGKVVWFELDRST